jgi:hypothetical protein
MINVSNRETITRILLTAPAARRLSYSLVLVSAGEESVYIEFSRSSRSNNCPYVKLSVCLIEYWEVDLNVSDSSEYILNYIHNERE